MPYAAAIACGSMPFDEHNIFHYVTRSVREEAISQSKGAFYSPTLRHAQRAGGSYGNS
jgi:hypothetical protein